MKIKNSLLICLIILINKKIISHPLLTRTIKYSNKQINNNNNKNSHNKSKHNLIN